MPGSTRKSLLSMEIIQSISTWIWGTPMLAILVGGGLWLTVRLDFFPVTHFPLIMRETFGKIFVKPEGEGTISPFQATCSALASTVGGSNIVGVPVALAFGGPGAVFWMWVTAIIGATTKYSEIALGLEYREKNEEGNFVGGPMYYLRKGLRSPLLGGFYALFLMLEIVPSISTQSLNVVQTATTIGIPSAITGVALTFLVGLVVIGGIKRIGRVAERLVPFMAFLYLFAAFIIVVVNIVELPGVIALIFERAFTPTAATGGFAGASLAATMRWGVARGCYSNEAGMGTASIAHAAAVTDHPGRQAMWGVFSVIVDTMIVCSTTAFVVLVTGVWTEVSADRAATMPARAFQQLFGENLGGGIVTICLLLFVLSTVIVIVYYGEKQAEYLFGTRFSKFMRYLYLGAILGGAFLHLELLYQFLDIFLAAIVIPNVIGLVLMSGKIRAIKDDFLRKETGK